MLKVANKIVTNILHKRLKPFKESVRLDHENIMDSDGNGDVWTLYFPKAIKKRVEHGLDSWLLLIDLIKAFYRVPRELL